MTQPTRSVHPVTLTVIIPVQHLAPVSVVDVRILATLVARTVFLPVLNVIQTVIAVVRPRELSNVTQNVKLDMD
jgi:hypothetical protein